MQMALRMGRSLADFEDYMGADEWPAWRAFALMYPFHDEKVGELLGLILAYMHNLGTDTEKSGKKQPSDFLPHLGTREATLQEVEAGGIRVAPYLRERLNGAVDSNPRD